MTARPHYTIPYVGGPRNGQRRELRDCPASGGWVRVIEDGKHVGNYKRKGDKLVWEGDKYFSKGVDKF